MHSQRTDTKGAGTQKYKRTGHLLDRTQTSEVSRWPVLTVESCWFVIWWRPSWHRHHFSILIHIVACNLLSSPHFHTWGKSNPPFSFLVLLVAGRLVCDCEPACQTGVLTGVICFHPAYREPRITWSEGDNAEGGACAIISGFNSKSSVKTD